MHRASRRRVWDAALDLLGRLLYAGFDVSSALRKERGLELEQIYYAGFHFVEEGQPLGEELLRHVIEKAGRKKIARLAKNKLALAGLD